jgi:hypothetical protein
MTLPTRHNRHNTAHVCSRISSIWVSTSVAGWEPADGTAPTRTISRAVNGHQIPIEPAAAGALPSATSCIAGLPTPADAGCGCVPHGRHPQTFT